MPARACSVPAAPPPLGVTSNFVNAHSDAIYFTTTCFALLAISTLMVLARFYTRIFILRSVGTDDYMILLALLFCAGSTAISQVQTKYGLGKHGWDVRFTDFSPNFLRLMTLAITTYFVSMFFIKLSLLFLYRRSVGSNRILRITWWSTLGLVVLYSVPCSLILLLGCRPIDALWDVRRLGDAKCFNPTITLIIQGGFNAFTDLMILVLALMIIRTLRLTKQQRVVLTILFVIGSLTCVISVYRITKFLPPVKNGFMLNDFTHEALTPTIWSLVEINSGIICSSIITLRPLLREYFNMQLPIEIGEMEKYRNSRRNFWKLSRSY